MTKKIYENPSLQVITLRARDIVTDSQTDSLDPNITNNIFDEQVYFAW